MSYSSISSNFELTLAFYLHMESVPFHRQSMEQIFSTGHEDWLQIEDREIQFHEHMHSSTIWFISSNEYFKYLPDSEALILLLDRLDAF